METLEISQYRAMALAVAIFAGGIICLNLNLMQQHRRLRRLQRSEHRTGINSLDQERARIAADLHDDLGPLLTTMKYNLAGIKTLAPGERMQVEQAAEHIDRLMHRVRQITRGLMPFIPSRQNMPLALEEFIRSMSAGHSLCVEFIHHDLPDLPQQHALHLFRIVQEIVHNTIRHAYAQKLLVMLVGRQNNILMHCADDGIGFNWPHASSRSGSGMGLFNIHGRVDALAGRIRINTGPGKGTSITIEVPLPVGPPGAA